MPTSARLEVTNLPKIPVKTVHSAGPMWASAPTTKYADAPGFAENFYRTTASCRAEQSPAPTNLLHQNSHVRYGRGCFWLFKLECAGIELVISALLGNQVVVRAAFNDAAMVEHHDRVGVLHR